MNTKFFAATNPGGPGHNFVKERWITRTCEADSYDPKEYDFIPAGVRDNPYLMENDPDYLKSLEMLPEKERKALLEGDWDIYEGVFFPEWSHTRHVVDDFDIPEDWQLILGWDDGTREPRSVHLYAVDNDQRVWCIWEYYEKEENLSTAADNIRRKLKDAGYWGRIYKCVVDPSMKRTDSQTGLSSVEVLESMGFGFQCGSVELGNNNRVEGWRVMKSYLSHKPYEEPLFKVFKSCDNMIRTVPKLTYHQYRSGEGSKKEDLDTKQEDHCLIGNTLVDLPTGQKPIKDLVGTVGRVISVGGSYDYYNVRKTGRERVYKVVFDDGTSIQATQEHPFLTSDFQWKSLRDLKVGDRVLDNRSKGLIQLDTHGAKSNKSDNTGVSRKALLQVFEVFSKGWRAITQKGLGTPLWEDSRWLSYTSQGWEFKQQSARELTEDESGQASFLSLREYERRNKGQDRRAQGQDNRGGKGVAQFTRGKGVAQSACEGDVGKMGVLGKGLRVLWEEIQDKASWSFKVLSSKLQGKSKTKKIKEIQRGKIVDVYNMEVNNVNCFSVEGGVIVHNCADEARYVLMSLDRLPSRFESSSSISIKKREYTPRSVY
jgi:hypothetical protein